MAVVALLLGSLPLTSPAAAAGGVICGQTITASLTLTEDLGPCAGPGLRVGANDVVLDLGGHRIFGTPATGEGEGIRLSAVTGSTVRNGTVTGFDAGVVIGGGAGNTVTGIQAVDNIGSGTTALGEGIRVAASIGNTVASNVVRHNGPFAGIRLLAGRGNVVRGNLVQGNDVVNPVDIHGGPHGSSEDSGIRLGNQTTANEIVGNTVEGSGFDGIRVELFTGGNSIRGNVVRGNGFHPPERSTAPGAGVRIDLAAEGNLVEANQVLGNAGEGILVRAVANRILFNRALGNATVLHQFPGGPVGVRHDLEDRTTPVSCHLNEWRGNVAGTASPACTAAP